MIAALLGAGFAGVVVMFAGYLRLPAMAPMHTGLDGVPSTATVPRALYLGGPLALGAVWLSLAFSVPPPSVAHARHVFEAGLLTALAATWWIAATFWFVAAVANGERTRLPRAVMPYGLVAVLAVAGTGFAVMAR